MVDTEPHPCAECGAAASYRFELCRGCHKAKYSLALRRCYFRKTRVCPGYFGDNSCGNFVKTTQYCKRCFAHFSVGY